VVHRNRKERPVSQLSTRVNLDLRIIFTTMPKIILYLLIKKKALLADGETAMQG
jgi:hypothetical protein